MVTKSVKETDLVLFTRQLATMIDAGIPLVSAPDRPVRDRRSPQTGRPAQRSSATSSPPASRAATASPPRSQKHPNVFNRLYISMVKAGETGGLLAEILDRLAGFLEASARLRKKGQVAP